MEHILPTQRSLMSKDTIFPTLLSTTEYFKGILDGPDTGGP
jgi:hypothetical protein